MFELIKLLETVYRTISTDLDAWFVFSIGYLVERKSKLLRDYMTDDNIVGTLADLRAVVGEMMDALPNQASYIVQ